jgi:uncharacterized MAPEG superfamily protein
MREGASATVILIEQARPAREALDAMIDERKRAKRGRHSKIEPHSPIVALVILPHVVGSLADVHAVAMRGWSRTMIGYALRLMSG